MNSSKQEYSLSRSTICISYNSYSLDPVRYDRILPKISQSQILPHQSEVLTTLQVDSYTLSGKGVHQIKEEKGQKPQTLRTRPPTPVAAAKKGVVREKKAGGVSLKGKTNREVEVKVVEVAKVVSVPAQETMSNKL